jgi:hypothetical protein
MAMLRQPKLRRPNAGGGFEGPLPGPRPPEEDPGVGIGHGGFEGPLPGPRQPEPSGPNEGTGRGSEAPRERPTVPMPAGPREPTPNAGGMNPIPFDPMGGPTPGPPPGGPGGGFLSPFRGVFGRSQGLQGGGLGLMSPTAGAENIPIDTLLQMLMQKGGR